MLAKEEKKKKTSTILWPNLAKTYPLNFLKGNIHMGKLLTPKSIPLLGHLMKFGVLRL